ncbi:odorant receptor 22c-like [Pseudomyrmex gracilis]|uniref:odorant receptor 22c-like n=1 Tax=Pseudomyrmex gracilis TaxID=219809 RepID=UPI000994D255|nr:odorant receptor 22c-like [Pseudomyrmex gracilis]
MKNKIKLTSIVCPPSVEFCLRLIGVWPEASHAFSRKFLYILSLMVAQIFQYQYIIKHFSKKELLLFVDVLSVTLAYSLVLIRVIIFAFKSRLLDKMIASMVEDWKTRDVSEIYMMTRIADISRRFSNLIIVCNAMSVFLYATGTFFSHRHNNQTDTRELLVKMEIPITIDNILVYVAILVTQFIQQTSAASVAGVLDCLLITLVLHVCGQIDLVRRKLVEITKKDIERQMTESIIKTLIVRHQKIIIFSTNIEAMFSNIALMLFISNTLIICCLGFLIIISIDAPDGSTVLVKSLFFYIAINTEAFIFCFVGEHLSKKSKMIGDAAYESLWYDLTPTQNRDLLFIIVRSQKHLTLTIGKVMDLSLQQFTSIVRASASYVSVLHAMY